MKATEAVADLLRTDLKWRRFFKRCCEAGAFRLRAQAWQFRSGLSERRVRADLEDVRTALLVVAGKTLPDTPAGRAAAGVSDWKDHPLDCECQDCSATMPRHVAPRGGPGETEIPAERDGRKARFPNTQCEAARADAKLAATGVVQTAGQAFGIAREHFGRDEIGASA